MDDFRTATGLEEMANLVAEPAAAYQFEPLSYRVLGAAVEVHRQLGPGFLESVYAKALRLELDHRDICWRSEVEIPVRYQGVVVGTHWLDLLVEETLIVELKAVSAIHEVHTAQLTGYLRAADLQIGLLLNFGQMPLGIKRIVNRYPG